MLGKPAITSKIITVYWQKFKELLSLESLQLFLFLPWFMAGGIIFYFVNDYDFNLYILISTILIALIFTYFLHRNFLLLWLGLFIIFFLLGITCIVLKANLIKEPILKHKINNAYITCVIKKIELRPEKYRLTISDIVIPHLKAKDTPKNIYIYLKDQDQKLNIGDLVKFKAVLYPLQLPLIPGGYDSRIDAYFNQVGAIGFNSEPIKIIAHKKQITILNIINNFRNDLSKKLFALMDHEGASITIALLVGDQGAIYQKDYQTMRNSGLAHILSISGMHLSLVAIIVFYLSRLFLALIPKINLHYNIKAIAAFIALVISFIYLIFAGYPIPAIRAFIMTALVLIAIMLDIKATPIRSLTLAIIIILLFQPEAVISASFQMSAAAVVVLVTGYDYLKKYSKKSIDQSLLYKIFNYFLLLIFSSILATLATSAYSIYSFKQYSNVAVLANLVAIPLSSFVIMPLILMSLFLLPFTHSYITNLVLDFAEFSIFLLMRWGEYVSTLPFAKTSYTQISDGAIIIITIGGLLLCLLKTKLRLSGLLLIIIGLIYNLKPAQLPDIIIGENGKIFALKDEHNNLIFSSKNIPTIIQNSWPILDKNNNKLKTIYGYKSNYFSCTNNGCTFKKNNKTVLIATHQSFLDKIGQKNEVFNLLINLIPYSYYNYDSENKMINNFYTHKCGSVAIYFTKGTKELKITSAKGQKRHKPWEI